MAELQTKHVFHPFTERIQSRREDGMSMCFLLQPLPRPCIHALGGDMVIFILQQIPRTCTLNQIVVVYGLERAIPDARIRNCAGAPAHNATTFYESMAALLNGRHTPNSSALSSMIEGRDHRDDVDQLVALGKVSLEDASLHHSTRSYGVWPPM